MKRFLKILIVACALLLMFGLVSCTNQTEAPGQPNASEGNNASAPSVAPQQNNATKPSAASEKDNALTSPPLGNGVTSGQGVKVHFIDVGQADSILIQLTDGKTVLIDGGNRDDAAVIDNYLQAQKVKTIDYLIATHPHEDHIGALPYLIKNYAIGSIYMPKVTANTKIFEDLLTQIKTKGLKINTAKAGVNLIDSGDTKLSLLAPNGTNYDETNEYSAVAKLVYKDTSFLFTGDAEAVSEKEMLKAGYDIKADLLKVGHHGGRTSTGMAFLAKVAPKYAVISVGKGNDYGHPHSETLQRLQQIGAKVYRTDELGTIVASSDGRNITINKSPSPTVSNKPVATVKQYIGNKNSKVFHLPSCRALPNPENQVKLSSREEAINDGFKPCGICKP